MADDNTQDDAKNPEESNNDVTAEAREHELFSMGNISSRSVVDEMEESYLDYAMSVIVSRALPDVRDGMPVHRRILYVMHTNGLRSSAGFRKSATVVGDVMGKYHPW